MQSSFFWPWVGKDFLVHKNNTNCKEEKKRINLSSLTWETSPKERTKKQNDRSLLREYVYETVPNKGLLFRICLKKQTKNLC